MNDDHRWLMECCRPYHRKQTELELVWGAAKKKKEMERRRSSQSSCAFRAERDERSYCRRSLKLLDRRCSCPTSSQAAQVKVLSTSSKKRRYSTIVRQGDKYSGRRRCQPTGLCWNLVSIIFLLLFCDCCQNKIRLVAAGFASRHPATGGRVKEVDPQRQHRSADYKENGRDDDYPWCFTGRLWFRPALVRASQDSAKPEGVSFVSLFGWTIGGTVALEYDTSPVGPYREYVDMGAIVTTSSNGGFGQWGSRLYVSTRTAEKICRDTWAVPAEEADICFEEDGDSLSVEQAPPSPGLINAAATAAKTKRPVIVVRGWSKTRILTPEELHDGDAPVVGRLPVWWTPSIKALWAPLFLNPTARESDETAGDLPVHRLRLSASALRLTFCGQPSSDSLGIPIGIGLVVDNVLIEISRRKGYV